MSGQLYIISAPSGAGKSTLVRLLLNQDASIHLSVSSTTRQARCGEQHGRDYFFMSEDAFSAAMERHEFLEWAKVHGNYYGTSKRWIADELAAGHDVLLEIDWQGAQQVRKVFPDALSIFIMPPSFAVLQQRLIDRATDSPETIARRLLAARDEVLHANEYNYVIINDELNEALANLLAIVRASRLLGARQIQYYSALFKAFL